MFRKQYVPRIRREKGESSKGTSENKNFEKKNGSVL